MKKLFIAAIMAVFTMTSMNAQTQAIKVNPVGAAFGLGNLSYEFSTTDTQSLSVSALYFKVGDFKGMGAGLEYKFYFDGDAIVGWYAAPTAGFLSIKSTGSDTASVFTAGAEAGHQWVFGDHFALDVNAGYAAFFGGDDLSGFKGGGMTLGVAIGYAW